MWGAQRRTVRSLEPEATMPLSPPMATDRTGPYGQDVQGVSDEEKEGGSASAR